MHYPGPNLRFGRTVADCRTSHECDRQIRRNIPNYDKSIQRNLITIENIKLAVSRAKMKDSPPCVDWPREPGSSTVYRLVEKIITDFEHPVAT